jgi:hypothetical protein
LNIGGQVLFSEAIPIAAKLVISSNIPIKLVTIIRDIYGRIRIAVNSEKKKYETESQGLLSQSKILGAYQAQPDSFLIFKDDLLNPDIVFGNKEVQYLELDELEEPIRVLDRQIIGQDWLLPQNPGKIPRLVFFGLKGGVGRSTALVFLARHLASKGKRVLLIDLDLESPGLSSMLLPEENYSDYGLIDWFVEDAVGQGEAIADKLVSSSPIGQVTQGAIRVASAIGKETGNGDFLPKLSRAYADVNKNGHVEKFSKRVQNIVQMLEQQENPDVVLIDSRAGLHDIAAISIVGLSTYA